MKKKISIIFGLFIAIMCLTTCSAFKNEVASVPTFFDKGMTTKNEVGHGMGLYKIKHILKKYNGAMEDEYFDGDEWISICVRLVVG